MDSGGTRKPFNKQIAPEESVSSRATHAAVCVFSLARRLRLPPRTRETLSGQEEPGLALLPGSGLASLQVPHLFLWPRSLLTWENIFTSLPLLRTSYKDLRWDGKHLLVPKEPASAGESERGSAEGSWEGPREEGEDAGRMFRNIPRTLSSFIGTSTP